MLVDVLDPNTLQPTGVVKPVEDAWQSGDWLGAVNIWVVRQTSRGAALLFQQRAFHLSRGAGKLEISVSGHYDAGETINEAIREAHEELGRPYSLNDLVYLGRRRVTFTDYTPPHYYAVDIFMVRDDAPLSDFVPEMHELAGLYECLIDDLLALCDNVLPSFEMQGIHWEAGGLQAHTLIATPDLFWAKPDEYYRLIAQTALRLLNGERNLRLWPEGGEVA